MAEQVQAVAQMLEAAEGHVEDGDVGPDAKVVFAGPEVVADGPQPTVLGQQGPDIKVVDAMGDDAVDAVPSGGVSDHVPVDGGLSVRQVGEAGPPASAAVPA